MKKPNFKKTPIALAITGMVLVSTNVYADSAKDWGRWAPAKSSFPLRQGVGGSALDISGGSLLVTSPTTPNGISGDQSIINPITPEAAPILRNPIIVDPTPTPTPAHPGDWVLYSLFGLNTAFGGEGSYVVSTGKLTLRPPAAGAEGGEVSVALNGFIGTGLSYAGGEGEITLDGAGGELLANGVSFSSASAEGSAFFPDSPEFAPFIAEGGELTGSLTGIAGAEGGGLIVGAEGGSGIITGGRSATVTGCCRLPALYFTEYGFDDEDDFFRVEGYGSYIAGQPTVDTSALQAGNVTADYFGDSSLFGFDVHVEVDFGAGDFTAEFNDGGGIGEFAVSGFVNDNTFESDTFVGATAGAVAEVVDAGTNGTFFGPEAEALGGIVAFETVGDVEGTFVDIYAAAKDGADVELPDITAPETGFGPP